MRRPHVSHVASTFERQREITPVGRLDGQHALQQRAAAREHKVRAPRLRAVGRAKGADQQALSVREERIRERFLQPPSSQSAVWPGYGRKSEGKVG